MKNYLVIQAARFGDIVQSKRLLLSLAASGAVHILSDVSMIELVRLLYPFAETHGIYFHGFPDIDKFSFNRKIFEKLRLLHFDGVFNLNFSGLTAQICRMFDPAIIKGYRPASCEDSEILCSQWSRMAFRLSKNRKLTPLNLVDFWGYFTTKPVEPCKVNPPAVGRGGGIGIAMSGREERRSVPLAVLARLTETMSKLLNEPPVWLLGTDTEKILAEKMLRFLPENIKSKTTNLCGATSWHDLIQIVGSLDALVCPDTGTMHLAAHLGVPTYAFFLSSAWCHETGPYGNGHHIWQIVCECSPCLESAPCPRLKICHRAIKSDVLVRSYAQAILGKADSQIGCEEIQYWQSGTDDFGVCYKLVSGCDQFLHERSILRIILQEYQNMKITVKKKEICATARLWPMIFNDSEWMLPPRRYC